MSNEITLKAWKNLETPSDHMYLTKDIERGQLPEILELAMGASTNPAVRDMLFLSTLSVCSYALPKMKMLHDAPSHTRPGYTPLTRMEKKMLSLLEALPEQFTTTQAIEIGNLLGMSRATVYRYLASLQEEGLLSGDWGNYSKTN